MKSRRVAFTLIELLVVVAIIALLISILMPGLDRARKITKNTMCMANLHQIGIAMHEYLADNTHRYPGAVYDLKSDRVDVWMPRLRKYAGKSNELFWCVSDLPEAQWISEYGETDKVYQLFGYEPGELPVSDHPEDQSFISYGYNGWGAVEITHQSQRPLGLGAEVNSGGFYVEATEGDVARPANMIAITDSRTNAQYDGVVSPLFAHPACGNFESSRPASRHFGKSNVLYADGHVIAQLRTKLIEETEEMRRTWNKDFLPHPKRWR